MSSILKALKKIEEDSPQFQVHQTLPNNMAAKPVFKSSTGRRRRKIFYLLMLLLIMAIATVMAYNQRGLIIAKISSVATSFAPTADEKPDPVQSRVYRAKITREPLKPVPKRPSVSRRSRTQPKEVASGNRNTSRQVGTKSGKQRTVDTSPPTRKARADRTPAGAADTQLQRPRKKDRPSPSAKSTRRTTTAKTTRSTAAASVASKPARTRSNVNYDRLADSSLKLQALAWAEEADRRMAVVNGSIVHEGESVDGYQVLEIRAEDVIVRKGAQSWRLEFGLQQ